MKIKELIKLNSTELLRTYMENQGIKNLSDKELEAAYGVCEGHGYELFTTDLKNGLLYKVDEEVAFDDEFELEDENDYSCETAESFLGIMLDYLGELCNDSYFNRDDFEESATNQWENYFETYNLLLDFDSKLKESYNEYKYTAEVTVLLNDIKKMKTSEGVFSSSIKCYERVYELVNKFLNAPRKGDIKDLTGKYNLSNEREMKRFLLEIKENSKVHLLWDNTYLSIVIRDEIVSKKECTCKDKQCMN